ncbi:MAG: dihydroneopterin aldolase [Bacteroidetes bacterium]|nr:dihydroneopterin aldolase [Bacteroidota bacterium]MBS1539416.1 dihydroneopterin aldolase [Bacteroidota bacterium]
MTGKITLEGLEFHAYHGIYPHERSSGNKFEVDVSVETDIHESAFQDDLRGTLNYEELYTLIKEEMEKPSKLLETVAHRIVENILHSFVGAKSAEIKISKFNPPIGGVCKKASVVVQRNKS